MLRLNRPALLLIPALALLCVPISRAQTAPVTVSSPDHRIVLQFAVQPAKGQPAVHTDGQLVYSVNFRGKAVLEDSALRLELKDQPPLGSAVHISGSTPGAGTDDYALLAGKTSSVHDAYNSLTIQATEDGSPGRTLAVEARVYNSAVAFRYHIP